jgi:hypothetical protein
MAKRGRRSIGDEPMSGTERNKRWKLKTTGVKPKRKAMSDTERRQKRSEARKVKAIMNKIIRAAKQLAELPNALLPLTVMVAHDLDFSKYTDDAILKLHVTSKATSDFDPHKFYRTLHHVR